MTPLRARQSPGTSIRITLSEMPYVGHPTDSSLIMAILCNLKVRARLRPSPALLMSNVADWHKTDMSLQSPHAGCWEMNGRRSDIA